MEIRSPVVFCITQAHPPRRGDQLEFGGRRWEVVDAVPAAGPPGSGGPRWAVAGVPPRVVR